MNAKDYIKEWLNQMVSVFEKVSFCYEYDEIIHTHKIEVKPVDFFEQNRDYLIEEALFNDEFEKKFYPEEILFISENSLNKINNPEFEINPNNFGHENMQSEEIHIVSDLPEDIIVDITAIYAFAA